MNAANFYLRLQQETVQLRVRNMSRFLGRRITM